MDSQKKEGLIWSCFVRLPAWTVPLYDKSECFLCNPSYLINEQSGDTLKENSYGGKTDEMETSPRWKLQSDHCIYFLRNDKWIIWSPQPLATLIFSWFLKALGMKLKQLQWERVTLIICYLRLSARCALIVITRKSPKSVFYSASMTAYSFNFVRQKKIPLRSVTTLAYLPCIDSFDWHAAQSRPYSL